MSLISEKCRPAEICEVKIEDEFWSGYIRLVRETMLPYQWEILNDRAEDAPPSHAVRNFRIAAGLEEGEFYGEVFQDSDLAKWMEAAAYNLESCPDKELEEIIDSTVELIAEAQQENGYLDTYFTIGRKDKEWTNLYECHEMYCMGHMMEAAAAYYKATGKRRFLEIMCRCADHIISRFGGEEDEGYPGHQELELALIKLYEASGEKKYLDMSCRFLERRGQEPNYFLKEWESTREKCTFKTGTTVDAPDLVYDQSHKPVTEQAEAVGHAVRAMYMYSAMAGAAAKTGNDAMFGACRRLWENAVRRQMYIIGALGASHQGEAFTFDYDLPNETAYAETCASVGLIFFAQRMLRADIDAEYADTVEGALYNCILGSMSADGRHFFYVNPMEVWPEASEKNPDRRHVRGERQKWFGCACCPPNAARLLMSLEHYICSAGQDTLYIHLYIGGQVNISLSGGVFSLNMTGTYLQDGKMRIEIASVPVKKSRLALRLPGWCEEYSLKLNGKRCRYQVEKGYAYLEDELKAGDTIDIRFDMSPRFMQADPRVRADAGKAALQRGPLVYCFEEKDNGENLSALRADPSQQPTEEKQDGSLPYGVPFVSCRGYRMRGWKAGVPLYRRYLPEEEETLLRAVPYFAWGNRGKGEMQVWIRT